MADEQQGRPNPITKAAGAWGRARAAYRRGPMPCTRRHARRRRRRRRRLLTRPPLAAAPQRRPACRARRGRASGRPLTRCQRARCWTRRPSELCPLGWQQAAAAAAAAASAGPSPPAHRALARSCRSSAHPARLHFKLEPAAHDVERTEPKTAAELGVAEHMMVRCGVGQN